MRRTGAVRVPVTGIIDIDAIDARQIDAQAPVDIRGVRGQAVEVDRVAEYRVARIGRRLCNPRLTVVEDRVATSGRRPTDHRRGGEIGDPNSELRVSNTTYAVATEADVVAR